MRKLNWILILLILPSNITPTMADPTINKDLLQSVKNFDTFDFFYEIPWAHIILGDVTLRAIDSPERSYSRAGYVLDEDWDGLNVQYSLVDLWGLWLAQREARMPSPLVRPKGTNPFRLRNQNPRFSQDGQEVMAYPFYVSMTIGDFEWRDFSFNVHKGIDADGDGGAEREFTFTVHVDRLAVKGWLEVHSFMDGPFAVQRIVNRLNRTYIEGIAPLPQRIPMEELRDRKFSGLSFAVDSFQITEEINLPNVWVVDGVDHPEYKGEMRLEMEIDIASISNFGCQPEPCAFQGIFSASSTAVESKSWGEIKAKLESE